MQTLDGIDPNLRGEAVPKQAQVWGDVIHAVRRSWIRSFSPQWDVQVRVSAEEVLADLTHGRD